MKRAFILFYFFMLTFSLIGQASTYVKYYNELGRTYQGVPDGGGNYYFLQADKNTSLTSIFKLNEHGVKIAESEKLSLEEPDTDFLVFYGSNEIALVMSGTGVGVRYYNENLIFQEEHYLLQADTMEILKVAASQNRMVFLFAGQSGKYYLGYATSRTNLDWIIDLPEGSHSAFRKFSLSIKNDGKVLVGYSSNFFGLYDSTGNKLWGGNYPFRDVSGFTENNFYIKLGSQLNKISFNSGIIWAKTFDYSSSGLLGRLDSERLFFGIETDSNFVYTIYDSSGTEISGSVIKHKQDSKSIKVDGEYVYVQGNKGIMKIHEELPFRGLYTYFLSSKFTPRSTIDIYWQTYYINSIDLYYSVDSLQWDLIGSGISALTNKFSWVSPVESGKIFLKIVDHTSSDYSSIHPIPLEIIFQPTYEFIETNNISMWVGADGMGSHDPRSDDSGLRWNVIDAPYNTTVFADGPVFGFYRDDSARAYASTYRFGFTPGVIYDDGSYTEPNDAGYFVYKAAKDWELLPPGDEQYKYEYAHENWPAEDGAPFIDNNLNGVYEPEFDEPDIRGDQMLWWSNHTADSARSSWTYGSYGDKIEIHTSVWSAENPFPDVVYKEYKFINKSEKVLTDFYFAYWADPDVGYAADDFAGVDTLLNLGFCYNSDDYDDGYFTNTPASTGYLLLDGPVVPGGVNDTARFNGELRGGFKNLPLTAFQFFIGGHHLYSDPAMGTYEGTKQIYNQITGKLWNGDPIIDPNTTEPTKFALAGYPEKGTGWYEGDGWPAIMQGGDRRIIMSSGPFTMAPGDTNCVTMAILNARGVNRIKSLINLKRLARQVGNEWVYGIITGTEKNSNFIPEEYQLAQNYPNPFNPSTVIELSLPEQADVKLEVFNILGEKIADLVNAELQAGVHKVDFNGEGLASGLYIYRLTAGDVNLVRKMMLLK